MLLKLTNECHEVTNGKILDSSLTAAVSGRR